jgi:hypothetical protein
VVAVPVVIGALDAPTGGDARTVVVDLTVVDGDIPAVACAAVVAGAAVSSSPQATSAQARNSKTTERIAPTVVIPSNAIGAPGQVARSGRATRRHSQQAGQGTVVTRRARDEQ